MDRRFGCDDCANCSDCAACCKGWDIELTKEDIRRLAGLGYRLVDFLEVKAAPIMRTMGRQRNCVFLDGKNMCTLEKRHGHAAKPHTCKLYPHIRTQALSGNDYFFYEYGGKTFPREFFSDMLGRLKAASEKELFSVLLFRLEKLRKQKTSYIDHFNYDDDRRHSELRKAFSRRRLRKLARRKFRKEEADFFGSIPQRRNLNVGRFVQTLQSRMHGSDAINPNVPEMLLAYLAAMERDVSRDAKKVADYFFHWNSKRF